MSAVACTTLFLRRFDCGELSSGLTFTVKATTHSLVRRQGEAYAGYLSVRGCTNAVRQSRWRLRATLLARAVCSGRPGDGRSRPPGPSGLGSGDPRSLSLEHRAR